jgi:hypothetical protein
MKKCDGGRKLIYIWTPWQAFILATLWCGVVWYCLSTSPHRIHAHQGLFPISPPLHLITLVASCNFVCVSFRLRLHVFRVSKYNTFYLCLIKTVVLYLHSCDLFYRFINSYQIWVDSLQPARIPSPIHHPKKNRLSANQQRISL